MRSSGEGGIRTWPPIDFIFNVLGSAGLVGAPNFPPDHLMTEVSNLRIFFLNKSAFRLLYHIDYIEYV